MQWLHCPVGRNTVVKNTHAEVGKYAFLKNTLADCAEVALPLGRKKLLRIHLQNADFALCKCIPNNNCLAVSGCVAQWGGKEQMKK